MLQDSHSGSVPLPASGRGNRPLGVAAGTQIRTDRGEVAVEQLAAGDMVLTRNGGLQALRAIGVTIARDIEVVRLAPGALGRPPGARELVLPAQQQIILRDWRAKALFERDALPTPAGALAGEAQVQREKLSELMLFQLHFDSPQVIWANGLELASTRIAAPTPHSRPH
ncbi:MAG: Hint domain-containing protein [Pararhodobacter sp.]|nr:Hint domain-containing protein [Pararhodobacter sp.]